MASIVLSARLGRGQSRYKERNNAPRDGHCHDSRKLIMKLDICSSYSLCFDKVSKRRCWVYTHRSDPGSVPNAVLTLVGEARGWHSPSAFIPIWEQAGS